MEVAEAWMKQKHLIPTIIVQVAGCDLKSARKLVSHKGERERGGNDLWTLNEKKMGTLKSDLARQDGATFC